MTRLEEISVETLEDALEEADGKKETMRLLVAIIYKRGPSVPMLAEWLDLREATIYRWFDRLEEDPIAEAVQDREKPGRPTKLTGDELDKFAEAVANPPSAVGFEQDDWTPELAREFISDNFDVEYTVRHVQRLLQNVEKT